MKYAVRWSMMDRFSIPDLWAVRGVSLLSEERSRLPLILTSQSQESWIEARVTKTSTSAERWPTTRATSPPTWPTRWPSAKRSSALSRSTPASTPSMTSSSSSPTLSSPSKSGNTWSASKVGSRYCTYAWQKWHQKNVIDRSWGTIYREDFCRPGCLEYRHHYWTIFVAVKKWITFTWHPLNGDQRRIIFQHSICFWVNFGWWGEIKYRCPCSPSLIQLSVKHLFVIKSDWALRQDWALSFENRNSMHCTSYQNVLKATVKIRLNWNQAVISESIFTNNAGREEGKKDVLSRQKVSFD